MPVPVSSIHLDSFGQHFSEGSVEMLNMTICLRVVGSDVGLVDSHQQIDFLQQVG